MEHGFVDKPKNQLAPRVSCELFFFFWEVHPSLSLFFLFCFFFLTQETWKKDGRSRQSVDTNLKINMCLVSVSWKLLFWKLCRHCPIANRKASERCCVQDIEQKKNKQTFEWGDVWPGMCTSFQKSSLIIIKPCRELDMGYCLQQNTCGFLPKVCGSPSASMADYSWSPFVSRHLLKERVVHFDLNFVTVAPDQKSRLVNISAKSSTTKMRTSSASFVTLHSNLWIFNSQSPFFFIFTKSWRNWSCHKKIPKIRVWHDLVWSSNAFFFLLVIKGNRSCWPRWCKQLPT